MPFCGNFSNSAEVQKSLLKTNHEDITGCLVDPVADKRNPPATQLISLLPTLLGQDFMTILQVFKSSLLEFKGKKNVLSANVTLTQEDSNEGDAETSYLSPRQCVGWVVS